MAMNPLDSSAYHGGSWRLRKTSHREECNARKYWTFVGCNSEFLPLKEVLLFRGDEKLKKILNPEKVQHLRPVDWVEFTREQSDFARALRKLNVNVRWVESSWFPNPPPNLMFMRDQLFMTPWGAILARMASEVRAGEEKWAQLALAQAGIPFLHCVTGRATFEGADALWLNPKTIAVGTGNRTNKEGVNQLRHVLKPYGVQVLDFKLPKSVQHLLGLLQIVARKRALVRTGLAPKTLLRALPHYGFEVLRVDENDEVTHRQGLNLVCLAPNRIVMIKNCPRMREFYRQHKIQVLAEISATQLLNAAGGLACALAPLHRKRCTDSVLSL